MKAMRQSLLLDIVRNNRVNTQEQLQAHLLQAGIQVNQATISRDIRELGIVKMPEDGGGYRYGVGERPSESPRKFYVILREAVVRIGVARNIVIVKCHTGMANAACAAIDATTDQLAGTIAGDDTIMAVAYDDASAEAFANDLKEILRTDG